jgi:hypothetical protein
MDLPPDDLIPILIYYFIFMVFPVITSVSGAGSLVIDNANRTSIFFLGSVLAQRFPDLTYFVTFHIGFSVFALVDIVSIFLNFLSTQIHVFLDR